MSTLARDAGMAGGRSVVAWLIAFAIAVPVGLIAIMTTVWLVTAFDSSLWTLVVAALLWLGLFAVAAAVFIGAIKRSVPPGRRSRTRSARPRSSVRPPSPRLVQESTL